MYPESTAFKSMRPSGSGDLAQNSTGHGDSGSALIVDGGIQGTFQHFQAGDAYILRFITESLLEIREPLFCYLYSYQPAAQLL